MTPLHPVLAAFLILGPLIIVHELGHFLVARAVGIRVLAFSIGFGPSLLSFRDRSGTEYRLGVLPLGGYVKMLDEAEGPVAEHERHQSFSQQKIWARMAVTAAGPVVNLLAAWLIYTSFFLQGSDELKPVVGRIIEGSPAATAGMVSGEEVLRIDGRVTESWSRINTAVAARVGENGGVNVLTRTPGGMEREYHLPIHRFLKERNNALKAIGFLPVEPPIPPVVGEIVPNGAGAKAGMKAGDELISANGRVIDNWPQWVDMVQDSPGVPLHMQLRRQGKAMGLVVTPAREVDDSGQVIGRVGVGVGPQMVELKWPPKELIMHLNFSVWQSMQEGLRETTDMMGVSLMTVGKLLTGQMSMDNLSGPIGIAKVASASSVYGWRVLLRLCAVLSVSLGVLNLLPIPVLDGGHILFLTIEAVRGRPLSAKAQGIGVAIGAALLMGLMLYVITNDIHRYF